jgi:phosphohistidine swiveling domain-containing protein
MSASLEPVTKVGEWHEFHKRARSPFFTGFILGAPGIQKPDFPFDHRIKDFGMFCDHVTVSMSEKLGLREKAVAHLKEDPAYLLRLMNRAYEEHAAAIARWKEVNAKDLSGLSQEEFAKEFAAYVADLNSFGIYVTLPLFVEDYMETTLRDEFAKRFGDDAEKKFGVAADPIKEGTVLLEEMARLKLDGSEETLAQHVQTFAWMNNTGFFEDYYDAAHYRALLVPQKEAEMHLAKLTEARSAHQNAFKTLLDTLSDDPYLVAVTKTANEAVYFRSYRTEMFYSSSFYNQSLLREAARRLGLSGPKEIVWLYGAEALELLQKGEKADTALISRRKEAYCYLSDFDGAYYSWDGEEAKAALAAYLGKEEAQGAVTEVKGSGAFLGKVTGKTVVLKDASEIGKVTGGEILVTHATNVNFVPALKKVIGIVTEEGGILSHAAIISRELRIPCVIGTKIATKAFIDGDMLELDAEKGIVRKI